MALTFSELTKLVSKQGLKFFEDPRESRLLLGMGGMHGKFEVVISLMDDGQFLQFRTVRYLECPPDDPSLPEVLKVIADLNLRLRLVKFAWDASDGEVLAYADAWLMDTKLTPKQLHRLISNFMPAIDLSYRRLRETVQTGKDPGELSAEQAVGDLLGRDSLPAALRKLLEKLKAKTEGRGEGKEEGTDTGEVESI